MRITTWAEYGLICALNLARRAADGPVTGRSVAAEENLPTDYVEQILLRLRRSEIVRSVRGARGGYALARPAEEITVRQVMAASELETFELHCASHPVGEERCSAAHSCSIRPVWMMLQQKIDDVLDSVRLSDLLHDEMVVRARVGLGPKAPGQLQAAATRGNRRKSSEPVAVERRLPILQG
ncbi:Rrf2 family transcriptional regulator [Roseisolibacter sp. H3M3-2]|uniref:RrF2 family transcriptional regulator n=1 Tax=Roseisolibacter sp. H3M3-2 TaxID=3031323 RepID=UPI0023DAFD1D|nr:Rrf2 family transcriptional regulator [Roseisolibacter sp. H3M3-2]MDF1502971.1 Rrf2 family transcriptional regulator [Roseisolibacter sp. H3M3-2]